MHKAITKLLNRVQIFLLNMHRVHKFSIFHTIYSIFYIIFHTNMFNIYIPILLRITSTCIRREREDDSPNCESEEVCPVFFFVELLFPITKSRASPPLGRSRLVEMHFEGLSHPLNFFRVALPHRYLHIGSTSRKIVRNILCNDVSEIGQK